jgi:GTPase
VLNKVDASGQGAAAGHCPGAGGKEGKAVRRGVLRFRADRRRRAELKARLAALMPEGPWHYPEDQVSDASERLLACEITREQLYRQLHDELPYDSAVRPESYTSARTARWRSTSRSSSPSDSQKGIVLGKRGAKLKAIGEAARKELANCSA